MAEETETTEEQENEGGETGTSADDLEPEGEGEKGAGDEEAGEGAGGEDTEGEGESSESDPTIELKETIAELREQNAKQVEVNNQMQQSLDATRKVLQEQGILEEDDPEVIASIEQQKAARQNALATMEEMTRLNPKFADYDSVVTKASKESLINDLTIDFIEQNPDIDKATADASIRETINDMANPFRFYYEEIKKLQTKDESGKKVTAKPAEATNAPGSVTSAGGGSSEKSGWTMTKIDDLGELEMSKVPEDVMDLYEQGKLPN